MSTPRLFSVSEVADILRVSRETVRALARRGDIASYRIGRGSRSGYRFTEEDIAAYLRGQRKEARRT